MARQTDQGGVLVHCFMGYSRSATIVLSYLMRKENLKLKEAMDSVMGVSNCLIVVLDLNDLLVAISFRLHSCAVLVPTPVSCDNCAFLRGWAAP